MLEQAIKARVQALSPPKFQRLAEAYAELTWPWRYEHLVPTGRNAENATTVGWPDAWAQDASGRVHVVEATKSRSGWESHLEEDVEHVKVPPRGGVVASFVFVCAKVKTPPGQLLKPYLDDLAKLGLGPADVELVFLDRLCRDLAKPVFARVRVELLQLPASTLPFVPVETARQLFGDGEAGAFQPTWDEHCEGHVHGSARLETVTDRLATSQWAYVRGTGGSGKTSLALSLAVGRLAALQPVYYVNLGGADMAVVTAIEERMTVYGGSGVLFVIDDAHLAESLAGRIYDFWRMKGDGSELLLVGRELARDVSDGYGSAIGDLNRNAVDVVPEARDFRGVYRRLALREGGGPLPPAAVCRGWREAFGADLLSFCSAISARGAATIPPSWHLDPAAALEGVERRYLQVVQATDDVLRLALLSYLELDATAAVVDVGALEPLVRSGLLVQGAAPGSLRTPHPTLGALILEAAGQPQPALATAEEIRQRDEATAIAVARRLTSRHRTDALGLWVAMIDARPASVISGELRAFPSTARLLLGSGHYNEADLDAKLCDDKPAWADALAAATPQVLGNVLGIVFARLPRTADVLRGLLRPDGRPAQWLVEGIADSDDFKGIGLLAGQLRRTWPELADELDVAVAVDVAHAALATVEAEGLSRRLREGVAELRVAWPVTAHAVAEALAGKDEAFWTRALSVPPIAEARRCAALLRADAPVAECIESAAASVVFVNAFVEEHLDALAAELGDHLAELRRISRDAGGAVEERLSVPGVGHRWAERALRASLAALPSIVRARPPAAFTAEVDAWLAELGEPQLSELVVATSIVWLAGVLGLPGPFTERVDQALRDTDLATRCALRVVRRPVSVAWPLLKLPSAKSVIAALPSGPRWEAGRLVHSLAESPELVEPIVNVLVRLGRQELAVSAALAVGDAVIERRVATDRFSLAALGQILRLGQKERGASWVEQVAANTLVPGWCEDQIRRTPAGGLAAAVFSLHHYAPAVAAALPAERVAERALAFAESADHLRTFEGAMRVTGAAALLGADVSAAAAVLAAKAELFEAFVALLAEGNGFISPGMALGWLGVRVVQETRGATVGHPELGGLVTRMRKQEVLTPEHRATLDGIADWLAT